MRILCIHTYYRQRGGEDTVYENEKRLMEQEGWEVRSVLFNNRRFSFLKFLLLPFNPLSFIRVLRAIGRFKPDIVHVHNWFFGASPSVFLAARLRRVPLIHTIHNFRILCPSGVLFYRNNIYTDSTSKVLPFLAIRRKVYRNSAFYTSWILLCTRLHYYLRTWQGIDRFICLTSMSKKLLCESFLQIENSKVSVKPNFFNPNGLQSVLGQVRSRNFLFIGRLDPEKGVEVLLSAFRNSPYSLVIAGDGVLRSKVERSARECGNITYLGFLKKEKIIEELRRCSALLVPSICYEQFGLVIIEAFSCGTPVIASDIGAPADLITDGLNGFHFTAGSPPDLLKKMEHWLSLPDAVKQTYYRNAMATYCKYFTPGKNFYQLTTIYKTLIHATDRDTEVSCEHR